MLGRRSLEACLKQKFSSSRRKAFCLAAIYQQMRQVGCPRSKNTKVQGAENQHFQSLGWATGTRKDIPPTEWAATPSVSSQGPSEEKEASPYSIGTSAPRLSVQPRLAEASASIAPCWRPSMPWSGPSRHPEVESKNRVAAVRAGPYRNCTISE